MKVLVLSGRFGMGHEMAANAICEQFRKLDKDTEIVKKDLLEDGMLPVKRTIKNNKFLYRQPCYGWRYFMLLLYIAHDISLVSLHAVSFEVVGCCSNLCN